jgi:hypothetical protein
LQCCQHAAPALAEVSGEDVVARMQFTTALAAAALALVAAPATAQPPPRKLELSYSGSLNALHLTGDLKVLALHVSEQAGAAQFDTHADLHSYGVLRAFKRIDVWTASAGPVEAGLPRPHVFDFIETKKDGSKKRTVLTWQAGAVVSQPPHRPFGQPPPTMALELSASDPVTQMSRIAYAASGGAICGHSWRFFDGVQLYDLQLGPPQPDQPTARDKAMGVTQTAHCVVHYVEVAGFRHKPGADTGIRSEISARFGRLGPAGPWVALTLKADTLMGYAKVQLDTIHVGPA